MAMEEVKRAINKNNGYEIILWEEKTRRANNSAEIRKFPYVYNPKETRINYLASKPKTKTRISNY